MEASKGNDAVCDQAARVDPATAPDKQLDSGEKSSDVEDPDTVDAVEAADPAITTLPATAPPTRGIPPSVSTEILFELQKTESGKLCLTMAGGVSPWTAQYELVVQDLPRLPDGAAGPAEKAGMCVGDEVVSVAGQPVDLFKDVAAVLRFLRNAPGQRISVRALRPSRAAAAAANARARVLMEQEAKAAAREAARAKWEQLPSAAVSAVTAPVRSAAAAASGAVGAASGALKRAASAVGGAVEAISSPARRGGGAASTGGMEGGQNKGEGAGVADGGGDSDGDGDGTADGSKERQNFAGSPSVADRLQGAWLAASGLLTGGSANRRAGANNTDGANAAQGDGEGKVADAVEGDAGWLSTSTAALRSNMTAASDALSDRIETALVAVHRAPSAVADAVGSSASAVASGAARTTAAVASGARRNAEALGLIGDGNDDLRPTYLDEPQKPISEIVRFLAAQQYGQYTSLASTSKEAEGKAEGAVAPAAGAGADDGAGASKSNAFSWEAQMQQLALKACAAHVDTLLEARRGEQVLRSWHVCTRTRWGFEKPRVLVLTSLSLYILSCDGGLRTGGSVTECRRVRFEDVVVVREARPPRSPANGEPHIEVVIGADGMDLDSNGKSLRRSLSAPLSAAYRLASTTVQSTVSTVRDAARAASMATPAGADSADEGEGEGAESGNAAGDTPQYTPTRPAAMRSEVFRALPSTVTALACSDTIAPSSSTSSSTSTSTSTAAADHDDDSTAVPSAVLTNQIQKALQYVHRRFITNPDQVATISASMVQQYRDEYLPASAPHATSEPHSPRTTGTGDSGAAAKTATGNDTGATIDEEMARLQARLAELEEQRKEQQASR